MRFTRRQLFGLFGAALTGPKVVELSPTDFYIPFQTVVLSPIEFYTSPERECIAAEHERILSMITEGI